ncbi:MAG: hypothetical protein KF678_01185 [Phycisphaeraceae bacterium]|nr:hypothetical protein [Phycisphaeraceae bacterium]
MTAGLNGHHSQLNGHAYAAPPAARRQVQAVVLLAGSVRPSDLSTAIDRSLLQLPVEPGHTVLSKWQDEVSSLAAALSVERLALRIVIDRAAAPPAPPAPAERVRLTVERDAREYRGTGGLLRDLAVSYAPHDLLLVANAAQILVEPLTSLVDNLFAAGGNVSFIGHRDGTPCGLFLVRCDTLASIRDIGFLDFKEQVLPKLGVMGHPVRPVIRDSATALPIRTLDGYLSGLRAIARMRAGKPRDTDPFGEDWSPTFAIVEPDAVVDPTATIHDSVVLGGAKVERGAVVVRSVIGPTAVVKAGETVADAALGVPRDIAMEQRETRERMAGATEAKP